MFFFARQKGKGSFVGKDHQLACWLAEDYLLPGGAGHGPLVNISPCLAHHEKGAAAHGNG